MKYNKIKKLDSVAILRSINKECIYKTNCISHWFTVSCADSSSFSNNRKGYSWGRGLVYLYVLSTSTVMTHSRRWNMLVNEWTPAVFLFCPLRAHVVMMTYLANIFSWITTLCQAPLQVFGIHQWTTQTKVPVLGLDIHVELTEDKQ